MRLHKTLKTDRRLAFQCIEGISKAGNHVVLLIGFTEFRAGIRTKHVRK